MSKALRHIPSESLFQSGSGGDSSRKALGELFDDLTQTGSKCQWFSVVKRNDGSLDIYEEEPESGDSIAIIANPNYGSNKDNTVNTAVLLKVKNSTDFLSFYIKGSDGLWSLLRIQNGQNKAYNALLCDVRRNDLNPNCNEFEAAIHGLKEAFLLGESKDVEIALGDLKSVFEYQIKRSAPKISDEAAKNRAGTCTNMTAFNLKVDIVNALEIMNAPKNSSDTKSADASATQKSIKPASGSTNRPISDANTAVASNNHAGKRNKQGKGKNSVKGNNTAKSKKLSAHKFKYASLNSFKKTKAHSTKLRNS